MYRSWIVKLTNRARFSTICLHAGQEPDPSTGAIVTPIYQTSTYVQEALGKHKGYEYSRTQNPTRIALERNLTAIEYGKRGIYNVVDDAPAPVAEWLPALAQAIGAPPPRHVPRWVGRLAAGEAGAVMMTETRGASNAKAKRELGWEPRHPSWRGFHCRLPYFRNRDRAPHRRFAP